MVGKRTDADMTVPRRLHVGILMNVVTAAIIRGSQSPLEELKRKVETVKRLLRFRKAIERNPAFSKEKTTAEHTNDKEAGYLLAVE